MKKSLISVAALGFLLGLGASIASAQEVLVTRGLGAASATSGTNTGDQTETCSAGQFVSTLAATTTSTCSGALEDGGVLNSAAFAAAIVADSPLLRYNDGGSVGISIPYASATASGAVQCASGTCVLDAGFVLSGITQFLAPTNAATFATTPLLSWFGSTQTGWSENPSTGAMLEFNANVIVRSMSVLENRWGKDVVLGWSSAADNLSATDTSLTRAAAGVVGTARLTLSAASGEVGIQSNTGAKTCLGTSGVGCLAYQTASASIEQTLGIGTAGSGTGYTAVASGAIRPFVHKLTLAETALDAAATSDETIWTIPAKTRMTRMVADVTAAFTGGGVTAVSVTCGTSAGGNQYLLAFDALTAPATFGDVAAEIGAGLTAATVADIPSFSGTTAVQCRFTCTTANCDTLTAGSVTLYLEGTTYP